MLFSAAVTGISCSPANNSHITLQDNGAFARTIAEPGIQIVDVRTPGEFKEGHIPNAINMDVTETNFDRQTQSLDTLRPVAVYCRSGRRSKLAARKLAEAGFQVYELDRGIMHWNGTIEK